MQNIDEVFQKTDPRHLTDNFIKVIGDEWMLITAGTPDKFNTMTASWGTIGMFWNKPVAICFIRPTRYTFEFAANNECFTLSFFTEQERDILNFCGTRSGKNIDKIASSGLRPLKTPNNNIGYEQSRLCIECKKVYYDDLDPDHFLMHDADKKIYPKKDYHRMFIGEIVNCYSKKQ
jgi:flavin reductase (DIM6/NTAB) family NADH-FMN oxidoreductase RutF